MSAFPFEPKDHLSALIAYRSLSSLALVIKNSSVSLAKKKSIPRPLTSLCEWLRLNVSCSEHVACFPSCRWMHQEAFSMWSGFIIAQALSGRCVKRVCVCVCYRWAAVLRAPWQPAAPGPDADPERPPASSLSSRAWCKWMKVFLSKIIPSTEELRWWWWWYPDMVMTV